MSVRNNDVKSDVSHSATPTVRKRPVRPRIRRLMIAWATTTSNAASKIGYAVQIALVAIEYELSEIEIADHPELRQHDHRQDAKRCDVDQAVDIDATACVATDDQARQPDGQSEIRGEPEGVGDGHVRQRTADETLHVVDRVPGPRTCQADSDAPPGKPLLRWLTTDANPGGDGRPGRDHDVCDVADDPVRAEDVHDAYSPEDGEPATPGTLVEDGPVPVAWDIIANGRHLHRWANNHQSQCAGSSGDFIRV